MILFKKQFRENIISGKKTTTLRKNKCGVSEGKIIKTNFKDISLKILKIEEILKNEISESIAKSDGFVSKEKLISFLENYAPGTEKFFLVKFENLNAS